MPVKSSEPTMPLCSAMISTLMQFVVGGEKLHADSSLHVVWATRVGMLKQNSTAANKILVQYSLVFSVMLGTLLSLKNRDVFKSVKMRKKCDKTEYFHYE